MTIQPRPRARDPIQLAKLIGDIATGQVEDEVDDGKDAAVREMDKKGRAARAIAMTPEQHAEIAKKRRRSG